jgi:hypothetical protein
MKKLEDIPKRNIFEVPDAYFDQLPLKIQAKVESTQPSTSVIPAFGLVFRYAFPVILVGIAAYLFWPTSKGNQDDLLASVSTESLISFLNETDLSTEDLIDLAKLDETEADSLNAVVNSNFKIEDVDLNEMQDVLDNEL